LQTDWDHRLDTKGLSLASGFLNAFAWIVFAYPVIQMAWLLSKQGTKGLGANVSIMMFALGGAITEWMAHLFWLGMNVASTQLVTKFNLDNWLRADLVASSGTGEDDQIGWRALEVNHISSSGFVWFVDSFEWLCLVGIFCCTYYSVRQWRMYEDATSFGSRWNSLTLFIGLLGLLEFVAEILRFEGFKTFGPIAIVYAILNRLILMPAWIISLGFMLPRATLKQTYSTNRSSNSNNIIDNNELALTEMNSMTAAQENGSASAPPPTFTIDDGMDEKIPPGPVSPPPEAFAAPMGSEF
jgi:hypothetical protein